MGRVRFIHTFIEPYRWELMEARQSDRWYLAAASAASWNCDRLELWIAEAESHNVGLQALLAWIDL